MGAPLRSRLQMDARRAQLLEHGLQLFGTRPYDEVSIDDIAERAEVSKGLLYHYFGGKRSFYIEVVKQAARSLLMATQPDPRLPPVQRGIEAVQQYLAFVEGNHSHYAALVTGGLGADREIASIIEHARMSFVGRIMLDLGLRQSRPVFRIALRGWIGGVECSALQWVSGREIPRSTLVSLILMGLRATVLVAAELDPDAKVDVGLVGNTANPP